MIDCRSPFGFH